MANTYHHAAAVHPPLRSTISATRCVCNGLASEHLNGSGRCVSHCMGQCTIYRPTTAAQMSWEPSYE